MTLEIQLKASNPHTTRIILNGKLDAISAPELDNSIGKTLANDKVKILILNLQELTFVSSAGLRIFAKARKRMKSRAGKVYFANLTPQVKKVFDIVKAVPVSDVFCDAQELDAYLEAMQRKATEDGGNDE